MGKLSNEDMGTAKALVEQLKEGDYKTWKFISDGLHKYVNDERFANYMEYIMISLLPQKAQDMLSAQLMSAALMDHMLKGGKS